MNQTNILAEIGTKLNEASVLLATLTQTPVLKTATMIDTAPKANPGNVTRTKLLKRYMEQQGFRTYTAIGNAAGISSMRVSQLVNGTHSPVRFDNKGWNKSAVKIANALGCKPKNLWLIKESTFVS
jgi:hypothetical protein